MSTNLSSDFQTVTLKIKGMHCVSCAMNIDDELEDLPGVIESNTSYGKSETKVTYDEKLINLAKIKDTIHQAGYQFET
jgi:Cu+-exporting ATPase